MPSSKGNLWTSASIFISLRLRQILIIRLSPLFCKTPRSVADKFTHSELCGSPSLTHSPPTPFKMLTDSQSKFLAGLYKQINYFQFISRLFKGLIIYLFTYIWVATNIQKKNFLIFHDFNMLNWVVLPWFSLISRPQTKWKRLTSSIRGFIYIKVFVWWAASLKKVPCTI